MNNDVDDVVRQNSQQLESIPLTWIQIPITTFGKFGNYLELKFMKNEDAINKNEQKELEKIFNLGLFQARQFLFSKDSPLLHNGKSPRLDVWQKLGKIVSEFLNYETFPVIQATSLPNLLHKALGNMDKRVIREYRKTILQYCNIDEIIIEKCYDSRLGKLDVSYFVSLIPKQYITNIQNTSSTSFSLKNE